jgi:hypothetical protein
MAHPFKYSRCLTDHVTCNKYSGQQLELIIHRLVVDQAFHMAPDEIVQRCQVWGSGCPRHWDSSSYPTTMKSSIQVVS